jgi:hypothetical protein
MVRITAPITPFNTAGAVGFIKRLLVLPLREGSGSLSVTETPYVDTERVYHTTQVVPRIFGGAPCR